MKVLSLRSAYLSITISILATTMTDSLAADANAAQCEQYWHMEIANPQALISNPRELLLRWQNRKKECSGTVVYEARLAIAYSFAGYMDQAKAILRELPSSSSKYGELIELSGLEVDFLGLKNNKSVAIEDVTLLAERLERHTEKYPNSSDGYALLGTLQTLLGEHKKAIRSLEKGLKSSSINLAGVYRNLAISYTALGRYQDAISAADGAYRLNNTVTSDQYLVYAIAKADAAVGDLHAAETALRVIAAKKPEVRSEPEFKEAVEFVMARMKPNQ